MRLGIYLELFDLSFVEINLLFFLVKFYKFPLIKLSLQGQCWACIGLCRDLVAAVTMLPE